MKIFIVFLPAPPTSWGRWLPLPEPDSPGGFFLIKGGFPFHCRQLLIHRGSYDCPPKCGKCCLFFGQQYG